MQTCGEYLDAVTSIVRSNHDTAKHLSMTLSPTQLEWRPTAYGRCVAEWVAYLGASGDAALAGIQAAMLSAWHDPSFENQPHRRTFAGRYALASLRMEGDGHNAMHHEARRSASPALFTEFLDQQSHLFDVIEEARDIDLNSAPAGWVMGRVFGLSVGDVLELIAERQRRGLGCVARVIEAPGFPSRPVLQAPRAATLKLA